MFDRLNWTRRLNDALALLEDERRLLLSGSAHQLGDLSDRRARAATLIEDAPEELARKNADKLDKLRRNALRNQRLLAAYIEGAKRASVRLLEIDRENAKIGTYGPDGTPLDTQVERKTLERRA